jgi:hypothetical protein
MENPQNSITLLIEKNTKAKGTVKGPETTRFMLEIPVQSREDLRTMCEKLGCKQIQFASELFLVALQDARTALNAIKK